MGKFSILCNSCRDDNDIENTSDGTRSYHRTPIVRLEKGGPMAPDRMIIICRCGNKEVYDLNWPFINEAANKRSDEEVE